MRRVIPIDEEDEEAGSSPWHDGVTPPPRRRAGGWILTLVMLSALGLLGVALERRYHVVSLVKQQLARQGQVDPRVGPLVADGERALSDGQLDVAQADFDKASVLTEKNPRVLIGQARTAAAKADIPWLRLRLLPAGALEETRTTKAELDECVAVARRTADAAMSDAPQDPRAICAVIDALRLAGEIDEARADVVAVFGHAAEPETAYVLAALDLAQPGTPLGAAVARLRLAAAGEPRAGRAQAALIYALAKSGDTSGARAELAKLEGSPHPYPLLPDLHAWLTSAGTGSAATGAPVASAPAAPSASPAATPPQGSGAAAPAAPRSGSAQGSSPLQAAIAAMERGDNDRAERIYQGMLALHPDDSQALAGIGDVRRQRQDLQGAIEAYRRAIDANPSYMPAIIGLGDSQWALGDRAGAARTYKMLVEHFPDGSYPGYVNQRAAAAP